MSELDKNDDVVEEKGKPISELRVHELKAELEKRSLSSAGVKAVLTARLNKALRDEGINTEEHRFFVNRTPTTSPNKPRGRPSGKVTKMSESHPEVEEKKVVEEDVTVENDIPRSIESSPEPDELRIIEDSFELEEHMSSMKDKDAKVEESKIEEPKVEEPKAEDSPIKEAIVNEPSEHAEKAELKKEAEEKPIDGKEAKEPVSEDVVEPSTIEKSAEKKLADPIKEPEIVEEPTPVEEPKTEAPSAEKVEADKKIDVDDEEVEGEDEFEEIEPEQPEKKEQKSVDNSQSSPADDEIFLEEEDLLEDPLDEPLTVSKTSTTTSIVSVAAAHSENLLASDTSLFGDEAKKTSIWIRGMTPSTKASSVKQLASQFGKVIQSKIFNSKPINGEIKNCFALVTFVESESMETAISTLHRKEHDGRILRVEKVVDSHLTGTAERIAKENEEKKKKEEETKRQEQRKKRAVIQAPESPKKPRQTIQAPEPNRKNRAIIQAPERSRSRERQRERKPITYESNKEETKRNEKKNDPEPSRDSRRIIAPARGSRVTPPRTSRGRDEQHQSLIISARVDTSGCRGGSIKRCVERTVPNNISTSELRRKQPQNQQSRSFSRSRVDFPDDGDHYRNQRPRVGRSPQPHLHQYPSRNEHYEGPIIYHDSRDRRDNSRGDREREKQREREMIEIIRRKEEEHRIREEKLQIEREREKMRFEQEKLERAKLELELTKQKLALQQAAAFARRGSSGDRSRGESTVSRRRHIEDTHSSGPRAKVHVDDRRGGSTSSRREATGDSGRHGTIPSARHVASEYGIQSNLGNSTSSLQTTPPVRVNNYSSPTKVYDQRTSSNYRSGGNAYEMSNNYQGYQGTVPNRYSDSSYQQQVWAGLDANGQMTMETHWTADSASASSSTTSTAGWQPQQYSNSNSSSNRNGRDYGYTRNHY